MADAAAGGGRAAPTAAGSSGTQIEAFSVQHVLTERRVSCLESWSQYALLGLSDGTLLLASQRPPGSASRSSSIAGCGGGGSGGDADSAGRDGDADGSGGSAAQAAQPQQEQGGQQQQQQAQQAQQLAQQQAQWTVAQSLRGFGTGVVKQLVVARERSMLLCLADDGVNAYVLPGMRLKGQAGRTRGAAQFAWHSGTDTLAVAVKRRVLLIKYDGLEFVEQREASLPDTPACMALAGGTLYVGLAKKEYVAVDVATGAITPLFATKGPTTGIVAVSPTEVLLSRDNGSALYGPDGRPSSKRGARSSSSRGRGKGPQGRGSAGDLLSWQAAPLALAASGPYVVALSEGGAEARLLEPLNSADMWQRLALPLPSSAAACIMASSAADDGSLYVANRDTGVVWQLRPVSFVRQAEQLLALGEHEEALAMAALAPPEQAGERRQLEDRIHLAFGQHLFRLGQYEEAMLHFGMSSLAGPLQLLRLFPSLAPPKLLSAAAAEEEQAAAAAAGAALADGDRGSQQQEAAAAAEGQTGAGPAAAGAEAAAVAAAAGEPKGEAFVAAVQQLMPYLLSHRSRLAAAAGSPAQKPGGSGGTEQQRQQQQRRGHTPKAAAGVPAAAAADEAAPSPATRAVLVQQSLEGSATAALLDTALLLALLSLPDGGALLRFVQRPNCVDLEAGEAALRGAGRYSELVALYQIKGRHAEALELLHMLSQSPEQLPAAAQGASAELRGLPGVWAAVKYVCHMPERERDLSLISTHAKWMLAADPDAGLEMFGNMQPPLPPSSALPMLTTYAPHLAGTYLEAALASGAADPAEYEQELARIYLERIVGSAQHGADATRTAGGSSGGSSGGGDDAPGSQPAARPAGAKEATEGGAAPESLPEYGKLRQLILSSRHLDYEALLRVVPQQWLLEIRAALLERLGRHTEALRIFVHRLRQPPLAEAYCDRVYKRRQLALREQRHAELAGTLRRRIAQREAAASAASGLVPQLHGYALQAGGGATSNGGGRSIGSGGSGSARSLQFEQGGAQAGSLAPDAPGSAAAFKLQPAFSVVEDGADIYLLLVQVLLEEEDPSGAFHPVQHAPDHAVWGEVSRLLSRKRDAIQPLHALGLLPGEVPLSSALPFLEGALWGTGERRRASAVARSLRRSEHIGLLGQLADARQRSIVLTPERNCSICYKRMGTAALVAFPSGLLAHYSCWRRASGTGHVAAGAAAANGSSGREWH